MNLHSMTGYALARRDSRAGDIVLELRSVNSRFLDPQFRISEELRAGEGVLREAISAKLARGKIDCRYYIHRNSQASGATRVNVATLAQLEKLDSEVRAILPQAQSLRVGEILHWPGVLESSELSNDEVVELSRALINDALSQLLNARAREGDKLRDILLERVTAMENIASRLVPLVPQLVSAHQQKLVERLQSALGVSFAEGSTPGNITREEVFDRIRQEITLYGVRIDVAEELSRLGAHLSETRSILAKGGSCGKRLDFMMQELNREANTLGSKAAAAELSDAAMELKLLIEQMREQVQNLE